MQFYVLKELFNLQGYYFDNVIKKGEKLTELHKIRKAIKEYKQHRLGLKAKKNKEKMKIENIHGYKATDSIPQMSLNDKIII